MSSMAMALARREGPSGQWLCNTIRTRDPRVRIHDYCILVRSVCARRASRAYRCGLYVHVVRGCVSPRQPGSTGLLLTG